MTSRPPAPRSAADPAAADRRAGQPGRTGHPGRTDRPDRAEKPGRTDKPGRTRKTAAPRSPAAVLPVAEVAVDVSLTHLDRPFDYLVPADLDDAAVPGARVRVRFAGRLVDGYLLRRLPASDHPGRLGYLERVISPEPVLTAEIAALARRVADRYVGSMADVLRLAVPPRHAKAEESVTSEPASDAPVPAPEPGAAEDVSPGWRTYPAGPAFLSAVSDGRPARAVWQALPGEDWPARLAEAAATSTAAGWGSLLLVPDARDVARLEAAVSQRLPAGTYTTLTADLGPAERYRRFLRIRRGQVRVVIGTRAAAFAPVQRLGLLAIFDDADDSFAEPRAPYPHAREVLMLRSASEGAALLVGAFGRSVEAQLLVESGWAKDLSASRSSVRERMPRIQAQGDSYAVGADAAAARARLSPAAFAAARSALAADAPVLVQVPRRGYLPALACAQCRRPARCRRCHGPLGIPPALPGSSGQDDRGQIPTCGWCGVPEANFVCGACGGRRLRAISIGAGRTAEELGRAFPGVPLITSAGDAIRDRVPASAAVVVATPGAEPVADGGYGAALLLDGSALLALPSLDAAQQATRRWFNAAALVRPAADGGQLVLGVDGAIPAAQALIRWDPAWFAAGELADRRELGFPPATAMISLEGSERTVTDAEAELAAPAGAQLLGPVPIETRPGTGDPAEERYRLLLRGPLADRRALAAAVRTMVVELGVRKDAAPPRVQVDPAAVL